MKGIVSINRNHQFRRLYKKGNCAVSNCFAVYCAQNRQRFCRLGITAGVKLGNAVRRNRVKRRVRALYRSLAPCLRPGFDIVVVARQRAVSAGYAELERSLRRQFQKLGLLLSGEGGA